MRISDNQQISAKPIMISEDQFDILDFDLCLDKQVVE